MTIFNYINDILFYKKGHLLNNIDDESQFNTYMVNRWVSMYSPQIAVLINHTTNRIGSALSSKRETYRYLTRIIPTCKPRKIFYIKKQSKKKEEEDANIEMLAKNLELSQREIILLRDFQTLL